MEKKDLKTGDKVTYRDGAERLVVLNMDNGNSLLDNEGATVNYLDNYSNDLNMGNFPSNDIMKIERVVNDYWFSEKSIYKKIWERSSEKHIEIQKELDALMDKAKAAGMNVTITIE